jgi:ectoine hydroxylase-related dioxygenase (phytanoyl-CoA dioxygenase family)
MLAALKSRIDRDGFAVVAGALHQNAVNEVRTQLDRVLERADFGAGPIRKPNEMAVASRNLLKLWPAVLELARAPAIRDAITEVLGAGCGLVRALYFDKPPGGSWSLPWHKDLTIAVREHRRELAEFTKPTVKGGVPHVEAPERVLDRMLTARVHLDDVTKENGPLLLVPGSHRQGKQPNISADVQYHTILVRSGDVLMMRPLLTHCSRHSQSTALRRRVVHLEFAAAAAMPDGYEWFEFHPLILEEPT